jgi:outer membrane receptor protein involved in Fe transport
MPSGNRGFFYPSASLGFVFTELNTFDDIPFLSYGKLRASYSEVGQAGDNYRPQPVFVTGGVDSGFLSWGPSYPLNGITGYKPSAFIYDKQLTPQNSRSYEFGIDLQFFEGRLGINYTYYDQTNEDQIFGVPIAGSTGYAEYVTNAGEIYSKGHELTLSLTPVKSENFTWNAQVDFTKSENVVEKLAEGVESITLGGYVEPNIRASAGDAYPAIYGNKFKRDEDGNILIDDDPSSSTYGMPIAGEFGKIGEVTPDFTLGLRNTFTLFKNIRISGHFHWKQGGEMYSGSNRLIQLYGTAASTEDRNSALVYDGVKASSGEENDIKIDTPGEYQTFHTSAMDAISEDDIVGTSFIKLRSASINYQLPADLFSNFFMEKASVGISVRNVLIWSEMDNFDPETSQGQGNMAGGMDYMSLPQTESYGFNVNFTF